MVGLTSQFGCSLACALRLWTSQDSASPMADRVTTPGWATGEMNSVSLALLKNKTIDTPDRNTDLDQRFPCWSKAPTSRRARGLAVSVPGLSTRCELSWIATGICCNVSVNRRSFYRLVCLPGSPRKRVRSLCPLRYCRTSSRAKPQTCRR